jgi:FkbM family methyltransferase
MSLARDAYWWTKRTQRLIDRATRGRVMVFRRSKHGIVDTDDIARAFPDVKTILDVGANTGQSAIRFRAAFPMARIISFEPIAETFKELQRRTARLNVECRRLALGRVNGRTTMYLTPISLTNSLVRPDDDELRGTEEVDVGTLDTYVENHHIDSIDLLKIDAEGFDLEVIAGASKILSTGQVRFVIAEVGLHPGDNRHPLFDDVRDALMLHGFRVFGLYDQTLEWSGEPCLRFANAVFCCQGEGRVPKAPLSARETVQPNNSTATATGG